MKNILQDVARSQRIVVKIGTSSLTYDTGKMNLKRIDRLAMILSDLMNRGKEIILVSSGSIGIGAEKIGFKERPESARDRQAAAAVGQCELMYIYDKAFSCYHNMVAQILLTRDDIAVPRRKRNTQNTMSNLIERRIIPVVNENDTVSLEEIGIGDNDNLSAYVAKLVDADLLILFSDIDGLYDKDPHKHHDAKLIREVYDIDEVRPAAGGKGSCFGTGGMITKLDAAEIATDAGIHMVILNGNNVDAIYDVLDGKSAGTLFVSKNFSDENIAE